jgi:hypothetical protein
LCHRRVTHHHATEPLIGGSNSFDIDATTVCLIDGELRNGTLLGDAVYDNHICGVVQVWNGYMRFSGGGLHAFYVRFIGGSGELMITGKLSGFLKLTAPRPDLTVVPPGCATSWSFSGVATPPMF